MISLVVLLFTGPFILMALVFVVIVTVPLALVMLVVGLVLATVLPLRVLHGKGSVASEIATPELVQSGEVIKRTRKGEFAEFGWDFAWPNYVPFQMRNDVKAVRKSSVNLRINAWLTVHEWWWYPDSWLWLAISNVIWFTVLGLPVGGLIVGLWLGMWLWVGVMWVVRQLVTLGQWITSRTISARDGRTLSKISADARCQVCFRVMAVPAYECSNPSCDVVHHDLRPGPLGIRERVCECGTALPTSVSRASKTLEAQCQYCGTGLSKGAGARRVAVIPVFGAVGAGKTQFLESSVAALQQRSSTPSDPLTMSPLTPAAQEFVQASVRNLRGEKSPLKTAYKEKPEGYPLHVEAGSQDLELHLMDAAGESFTNMETSRSLSYMDQAPVLIYLLDPFAYDENKETLALSGGATGIQVAQGSPGDSYGSVVDRLKASGADLSKRKLAVVVTKSDWLDALYPDQPPPRSGELLKHWLYNHGADALVRDIDTDFSDVDYFAVDSLQWSDLDADLHPLRVIDWAIQGSGGQPLLTMDREPALQTAGTEDVVGAQ